MLAAWMIGAALWTMVDWPNPARQTLLHKACFALYHGLWWGTLMALFATEPGDRLTPLIYLAGGIVLFGPFLLFFTQETDEENPVLNAQVPGILLQLLLGITATALMLASGAPVSAAAMLAASALFTLPVPSIRQLTPAETRLRTALFLLLAISAIAVVFLY